MEMFSLCDDSRCVDRGVQNDEVFSVFKAIMPSGHRYVVCSCKPDTNPDTSNGFQATFRINTSSKEEFVNWWKKDFKDSSMTTLRLKRINAIDGERMLYSVEFRCQHNTQPRTKTAACRIHSKNTYCPATASARVHKTTHLSKSMSRSADPHINDYPTRMRMTFTHNHPIKVAEALKFRDVSDATKKKLEELLLSGYRPSAALNLLKYDLQLDDPEAYVFRSADRAQCPDKQYVYRLAYALFATYYGRSRTSQEQLLALKEYIEKVNSPSAEAARPEAAEPVAQTGAEEPKAQAEVAEPDVQAEAADPDFDSSDDFDFDDVLLGDFDRMVEKMRMKFKEDKHSFRDPMKQMVKSFQKINTDSHLASAMVCFGKNTGVALPLMSSRKRLVSSKDIGVQPGAKQRRVMSGADQSARVGRPPNSTQVRSDGQLKPLNGACLPRKKASHSLKECVQSNCSLGKNHSPK